MKTFLLVKLGLSPAVLFWVLAGAGQGRIGLTLGAFAGLAIGAWNLSVRRIRPMEIAFTGFLVVAALAERAGLVAVPTAVAASFVVLGVTALVGCALRRPWTSDYAAAARGSAAASPVFFVVNFALSALWGVLFLVLGALVHGGAGPLWSALVTGAGALVSVFGPNLLVDVGLRRAVRARETFHWPAPDLSRPAPEGVFDVAVVGAGLGGLTAAALLARAGLKVVVCEHHVVPGGFAHTWLRKVRHDGVARVFRFDSGVHDVSGVRPGGSVSGLLDFVGATLDWVRLPQALWLDDAPFPVAADWRDHRDALCARHPASAAALGAVFDTLCAVDAAIEDLGRGHAGAPMPPATPAAMLAFARAHPLAVAWMDRPFAALLDAHAVDPAAREPLLALSGYLTDRPEELTVLQVAPLVGYWIHGGHYPKGGSGRLGAELAGAVRRFGGEVLLKSPVAEILVENGRASGLRLAPGRRIAARTVISNADLRRTFLDLVPRAALPAGFVEHIAAAEPATSAFMVGLALDRPVDLAPISAVVGTDGLHVHVVAPSRVDPTAAPDGFATLELIGLIPQADAAGWFADLEAVDDPARRSTEAYACAKAAFGDRMIAAVERLVPDLRTRIVMRVDASPLTFARYDRSSRGAIYGVAAADRFVGTRSPVPGLWLAGAGNFGPGVEAAMISGARTAQSILPDVFERPAAAQRRVDADATENDVTETTEPAAFEPALRPLRGTG